MAIQVCQQHRSVFECQQNRGGLSIFNLKTVKIPLQAVVGEIEPSK